MSLSCVVSDGDLPLHIYWTFNKQQITLSHDVSIAKLGKRNSVLTIESINARHAGNYTCHAENSAGRTSFSTELKVIGAIQYFFIPTSHCLCSTILQIFYWFIICSPTQNNHDHFLHVFFYLNFWGQLHQKSHRFHWAMRHCKLISIWHCRVRWRKVIYHCTSIGHSMVVL